MGFMSPGAQQGQQGPQGQPGSNMQNGGFQFNGGIGGNNPFAQAGGNMNSSYDQSQMGNLGQQGQMGSAQGGNGQFQNTVHPLPVQNYDPRNIPNYGAQQGADAGVLQGFQGLAHGGGASMTGAPMNGVTPQFPGGHQPGSVAPVMAPPNHTIQAPNDPGAGNMMANMPGMTKSPVAAQHNLSPSISPSMSLSHLVNHVMNNAVSSGGRPQPL